MSKPVFEVFLGLGSNMGDRLAHLREAVRHLGGHPSLSVVAGSPVYESEAQTLRPEDRQSAYLNAVVMVHTRLSPGALLPVLLGLEQDAGRPREREAWAPRPLDVDILAHGRLVVQTPTLKIPHPRLAGRRFVLEPWAAIAPDWVVPPPFDATVAALLAACEDPGKLSVLNERLLD